MSESMKDTVIGLCERIKNKDTILSIHTVIDAIETDISLALKEGDFSIEEMNDALDALIIALETNKELLDLLKE